MKQARSRRTPAQAVKPLPRTQPVPRLSADERKRVIVREAVSFFATHGLEGQTRELAKRLGIAQGLLYRHFPTKDALIDRVFEEVFVGRWNPQWEVWIEDRSLPLYDRLLLFSRDYAKTVLNYEWIRLWVLSGMRGYSVNDRYMQLLRERVFRRIAAEIRHQSNLPPPEELAITERELELVWGLSASIFYIGVRRWILGFPFPRNLDETIEDKVKAFLSGVPCALTQACAVR